MNTMEGETSRYQLEGTERNVPALHHRANQKKAASCRDC
jgi:hypothetical protein